MIYEKYPNWDIDVEKGTVYSLCKNKYVGSVNVHGYLVIKHKKPLLIHRVIWECVNGEIPNGYDIHHIDGNKENNSIYNLELINHQEHAKEHKSNVSNKTKNKLREKKYKKVVQLNLNNQLIKIWDSIKETNEYNYNQMCIINCCKGRFKQHKGFKWMYLEDYEKEKDVA